MRAVNTTSPPALSIAARAALTRAQREVELVEWIGIVAGEVLNRQPSDAGLDAARHVLGHGLGVMGEAVLEIGVERHVGRCRDLAVVGEHFVDGLTAIRVALRMGVA